MFTDEDESLLSSRANRSGAVLPFPSLVGDAEVVAVNANPAFNKIVLSTSSYNELAVWSVTMGLYMIIPALGFYATTQYAASAIRAIATNDGPGWTFAEHLVALGIVAPVVLGTSSVQKLLANTAAFINNPRSPGMLYSGARLAALAIALLSSQSTGFTVYNRLNGQVSESFLPVCYIPAMISATLTNFLLEALLVIDPIHAYFTRLPPFAKRDIVLGLLNDCLVEIAKLERAIFQGEADATRSAYSALVMRYVAMRDAPDLVHLTYQYINLWRESFSHHRIKSDQQAAQEKTDLLLKDRVGDDIIWWIMSGIFLTIAGFYTSTTYFSGLKAGDFARTRGFFLSVPISGQAIAVAAYSVNTMINFFSLWTLARAVNKLWQARQEGYRRDVSGIEWARFGLEFILVLIYAIGQMGMAFAFPAEFGGANEEDVAYFQLGLTAIVAPALGLFSLSSALDRVQNYWFNLLYKDTLTKSAEDMFDETRLNMRIPTLTLLNGMTSQLTSSIAKVKKMSEEDAGKLFDRVDELFSAQANAAVEGGAVALPRNRLPSTAQYEERGLISPIREVLHDVSHRAYNTLYMTTDRTSLIGAPSDLSEVDRPCLDDLTQPFRPNAVPSLQANPLMALQSTYQPRKSLCAAITNFLYKFKPACIGNQNA